MAKDHDAIDSEVGPYGFARSEYFWRRHRASVERRQRAAASVRILESNLAVEVRRLDQLRAALVAVERVLAAPAPVVSSGPRRRAAEPANMVADQVRHVEHVRTEIGRQRRLMGTVHADRLTEWAVEHGERRIPEPGQVLLARRSKKPWRQDSSR